MEEYVQGIVNSMLTLCVGRNAGRGGMGREGERERESVTHNYIPCQSGVFSILYLLCILNTGVLCGAVEKT